MLREISKVRQLKDDYFRRCFTDETLNLLVWYKPDKTIYGFQLCYDPAGNPRALTWTADKGLSHSDIDDGEESPLANRSPMLRRNAEFDSAKLLVDFSSVAGNLPAHEKEFVLEKLASSSLD